MERLGTHEEGWNENAKSAKDSASLETPITPAENTKIQSDEGGEVPADDTQWMHAVTKQESVPNANYSLIDSGAATSVCQQSLADSLGGKTQRTWSGAMVSHRTSVQDDWQHDNLLAHTRRCQRGE